MKKRHLREARQLAFDLSLPGESATRDIPEQYAIDQQFPEKFANQLSRLEAYNKHLYRPNTYLHKWWARRCGSTFRTILKQFVSDPKRLDYYSPRGLEGKIVLDPMMGGGTTLHEAIRLGANVIGADIDPIPIIQARASLSLVALKELRRAFRDFYANLYSEIGEYFQTKCPDCAETVDIQYTLYGSRKYCNCGEVVQIDQFDLRHESDRVIQIWPNTWAITDTKAEPTGKQKKIKLITRDEKECAVCRQKYTEFLDVPYYQRYTQIAIAAFCEKHGFFFRAPDSFDADKIDRGDKLRNSLDFGPKADFTVKGGPKSKDLLKRNISNYLDVFTSRQLLYLHRSTQLLQEYNGAIKTNLALLISTSVEFNSLLCGYKGWAKNRPGAIKHVFAHHAYSFPYTAAENNPINTQKASGNLQSLFQNRIERGRKWAVAPLERKIQNNKTYQTQIHGEFDGGTEVFEQSELSNGDQKFLLVHGNSQNLPIENVSVDFIVTDPPYYDSVQYTDLAEFFRVWLASFMPGEIDWNYDETKSAVAKNGNGKDTQYLSVLSGIFKECGRVLKPDTGRLVFTFHHWDPNAWADLTIALKESDFHLINAYVVFSENPISIHIQNLNAIKHDTILVLTRDGEEITREWKSIQNIQTDISENFCRQCGVALGWLLESDQSPEKIRQVWNEIIRGRN